MNLPGKIIERRLTYLESSVRVKNIESPAMLEMAYRMSDSGEIDLTLEDELAIASMRQAITLNETAFAELLDAYSEYEDYSEDCELLLTHDKEHFAELCEDLTVIMNEVDKIPTA